MNDIDIGDLVVIDPTTGRGFPVQIACLGANDKSRVDCANFASFENGLPTYNYNGKIMMLADLPTLPEPGTEAYLSTLPITD
tara:strand:+ start:648 stop:893 length:246 start_codon:yes stop_codon:yes gene_type:complete